MDPSGLIKLINTGFTAYAADEAPAILGIRTELKLELAKQQAVQMVLLEGFFQRLHADFKACKKLKNELPCSRINIVERVNAECDTAYY